MIFKNASASAGKKVKDRIIVLLTCNMTRTNKMKLLVRVDVSPFYIILDLDVFSGTRMIFDMDVREYYFVFVPGNDSNLKVRNCSLRG
jgi:hypothetical protein